MRIRSLLLASAALMPLASPVFAATQVAAFENTITDLVGDIYAALDVVSRELVGFLPGVSRDAKLERAALNQVVTYDVVAAMSAADIAPAMTPPTPADQTIGTGTMSMTKARTVGFAWNGEQTLGLNNGAGHLRIQAQQIAQALRTLTNEMETDIATAALAAASRAYGTVGTVPFTTNTGEAAQLRKILDDNGAPASGRSTVIDTTTGAQLRTLTQLTKVNEAGSAMTLRDGQLLDLSGLAIRESAALGGSVTAGTNNGSAATTNAGFAIGVTTIALGAAGTGTILAGDVITIAGDTNKYLVVTGDADVSNGGSIVIAAPGLRKAIPASATVITTVATRVNAGLAFSQDAIVFASRAPALPKEGDSAFDRMMIQDPRSGIVFEFAIYKGYKMNRYEVSAVWGQEIVKTAHMALLLR